MNKRQEVSCGDILPLLKDGLDCCCVSLFINSIGYLSGICPPPSPDCWGIVINDTRTPICWYAHVLPILTFHPKDLGNVRQ